MEARLLRVRLSPVRLAARLSMITMKKSIWKQTRYPEHGPCQRAKNSNERP